MEIKLNKWQDDVYFDDHRFKVICAGRRSGKSVLSRLFVISWALKQEGLYWIVSPTYKQSKQIHWRELTKELSTDWVAKTNEVDLSVTLKNGSIIQLKGAENPDSLRGVKLRGLVVDEIASIRNWDWLWSEVLRPTLTDYEAPAIFISTPKGYNHFFDLFQAGETHPEYKAWRFTSYDNPYVPKDEIDKAKAELTEDTFAQEYLADFRQFTGLVYKGFDRNVHVIDPIDIKQEWQIVGGIDFGSTNPTAFLWVGIDKDNNYFVVDEHYETGQTIDYHAGRINANPLTSRVTAIYGDPSGAQWINEFSTRRIFITPANKDTGTAFDTWVRFGIEKVAELIKIVPGHFVQDVPSNGDKGLPKLFVFRHCVNFIREMETYRWRENSVTQAQDMNQPDAPEKANDHSLDALRYIVVSHNPSQTGFGNYQDYQWKIAETYDQTLGI